MALIFQQNPHMVHMGRKLALHITLLLIVNTCRELAIVSSEVIVLAEDLLTPSTKMFYIVEQMLPNDSWE